MDEVATILGGADHLEEAILNLKARAKPKLIGVATTALVETRGEDFGGELAAIKARRVAELDGTELALAQTPDFDGAIEEGWSKAVVAMIEFDRPSGSSRAPQRAAGQHPAGIALDRRRRRAHPFDGRGFRPRAGRLPRHFRRARRHGAGELGSHDLRRDVDRRHPLARRRGSHHRDRRADAAPAQRIEELTGVEYALFRQLYGLKAVDRFVSLLTELSGRSAPASIRRRRAQLQDALLDGHFHYSGKKIAIAAEPDLLYGLATFFVGMGAEIQAAVTTTGHSKILEHVPCDSVKIGDLGDFEAMAEGADLLVTHSHGRQASERLGIPLMRVGFPIFDRLGSQHKLRVGYEGARNLIFEAANIFEGARHEVTPDSLNPFLNREKTHGRGAASATRQH